MDEETRGLGQRPAIALIPYALALVLGLGVGWLNVSTDDDALIVLPLLAATFLLGFAWPRHAWRWAILVAIWLPIGQAYALATEMRLPYLNTPEGIFPALLIGLVLGLAGAYAGALGRWLVLRPGR